jgi:hypothetical protein
VNVSDLYPRRRADVNVRVIEGDTLVLDRRLRQIHQLNATASFVWDRCDGQHAVTEIAAALAGDFEVDPEIAERDAAATVRQFAQAGLLQDHDCPTLQAGPAQEG